jgi:hypothetical protein
MTMWLAEPNEHGAGTRRDQTCLRIHVGQVGEGRQGILRWEVHTKGQVGPAVTTSFTYALLPGHSGVQVPICSGSKRVVHADSWTVREIQAERVARRTETGPVDLALVEAKDIIDEDTGMRLLP